MRTIETNIFNFSELSEEAKQTAINQHREYLQSEDFWGKERQESYEAAELIYKELHNIDEEISGGRLVAWIQNNLSNNWTKRNYISKHTDGTVKNSDWQFKYDCTKKKLSRVFTTNNLENCPLTGVCYDYDFLKPIIDFLKKPSASVTNMDLTIPDYDIIRQNDMDGMDDNYVTEAIEANGYEFTENGELI